MEKIPISRTEMKGGFFYLMGVKQERRTENELGKLPKSATVFQDAGTSNFSPGRTSIRPDFVSPQAVPWRQLMRAMDLNDVNAVREAVHAPFYGRSSEQLDTITHAFEMVNLQRRRDWNKGNARPGTRLRSTNGPMRVVRPSNR